MMNAAVNNKDDDPPFDVAMRAMVARHGAFRVMVGALWQMLHAASPAPLVLNAHLRRDVGLPPDEAP
jgi:hypothetical protein